MTHKSKKVRLVVGGSYFLKHGSLLTVRVRIGLGHAAIQEDKVNVELLDGHLLVLAYMYPGAEYSIWADEVDVLTEGRFCDCERCLTTQTGELADASAMA